MDHSYVPNASEWCAVTSEGPSLSLIFYHSGLQGFDIYTEFYSCIYMIYPVGFITFFRELKKDILW